VTGHSDAAFFPGAEIPSNQIVFFNLVFWSYFGAGFDRGITLDFYVVTYGAFPADEGVLSDLGVISDLHVFFYGAFFGKFGVSACFPAMMNSVVYY